MSPSNRTINAKGYCVIVKLFLLIVLPKTHQEDSGVEHTVQSYADAFSCFWRSWDLVTWKKKLCFYRKLCHSWSYILPSHLYKPSVPLHKVCLFFARISSNCSSSSTGCSYPPPSPVCLFKVWPLCYTCVHRPPSLEPYCYVHLCVLAASWFLNVLINYYRFCLPLWEIECLLCYFCVARETREGFSVNTGLNLRLRVTV